MTTIIQFSRVSKTYTINRDNQVVAVREINLEIGSGEFVVITGRSGSGKTTVLNLAAGLTRPTSGAVALDGVDLWSLADEKLSRLRNRRIGFIFQFPSLLPSLTAAENVVLPTAFGPGLRGPAAHERAIKLLDTVGLADKVTAYPHQLSAGQQQRVVIARALMNEPEILLADEPTSNLDEQTEGEIMELLREIHASRLITILLVTHTRQLVRYGTRAIQMVSGIICNNADS
jgi:putative ABC transport system ATP-binding protein/lipoprotein-releasing system ATP-binding protein